MARVSRRAADDRPARAPRDGAAGARPLAMDHDAPVAAVTLILRLHRDREGRLVGFAERPRTGAKEPFGGLAGVPAAIEKLLDAPWRPPAST